MDEHTVLGLLMRRINEDRIVAEATLCGGQCVDYAAYREMCGRIHGLNMAFAHIEDMVRRLRENNE